MTNEQLSILVESWANRLRVIVGNMQTKLEDLEDEGVEIDRALIRKHVEENCKNALLCFVADHIKSVPEGEMLCMRPLVDFVDELDNAVAKLKTDKEQTC